MKGKLIWILAFFTFLAAANVVNATIMWFDPNMGPTSNFTPYLLGGATGAIPVYAYWLVSVIFFLALLGGTANQVVNELPSTGQITAINDRISRLEGGQLAQQNVLEGVKARVFLVDEGVERTRTELSKGISAQGDAIRRSVDDSQQTQQKVLDGVQGRVFLVEDSIKSMKKGLGEQTEAIKGVNANIVDKINPQLGDFRASVVKQFENVGNALAQLETNDRRTVAAVANQTDEIANIKSTLERLEGELFKPKPLLTSQSNVEDLKGIGSSKGAELKEIGVVSVGDLIMADPKTVAEKMGSTEKTVEKLQGRAQLSIIPNIDDKDLLLLEELDILDRKTLAQQDPIELSKKINAVFKVNVARGRVSEADKPTIEEIDSWVKYAGPK